MGVRATLLAELRPLLPKKWKVIPYQTNLDTVDVPTIMFKLKTVARFPEAPMSKRLATFTVTLIEPKDTPGDADDALDDELLDLLAALDTTKNLRWSSAERVAFNATNPAYDIDLDVITQ